MIGDGYLSSVSSTSSSLLDRVKAHDPDAWQRLARLYGPLVFLWCRQLGVGVEDAKDVVQEVFLTVVKCIGDFRRDQPGSTFRGWLRTITKSKVADERRRRQGQMQAPGGSSAQQEFAQVSVPNEPLDPAELETGLENNTLLRRALELIRAEFEDRTWKAFWGMAMDGRPAADVAADMGMTTKAVRQAKYRVVRRLRQEMEGLLD